MEIKITSKHMELTEAIHDYAEKKLERLPRYFDRVSQVTGVVDRSKLGYTMEIIVDVEHHDPFIATSEHEDLYACIDLGVDRSIRQLSDHKSKVRDHKHQSTGGKPQA